MPDKKNHETIKRDTKSSNQTASSTIKKKKKIVKKIVLYNVQRWYYSNFKIQK